jgi:Tol biopolymer transport system component
MFGSGVAFAILLLMFAVGWHVTPAIALTVENRLLSVGQPGDTGNGRSTPMGLASVDGRFVLFGSEGNNFVDGIVDLNAFPDVFLHDRVTGLTRLVSRSAGSATVTANSSSNPVAISPDGEWVLFESFATDLIPGMVDGVGRQDVFLYQVSTGVVTLVSRAASSRGTTGNGPSYATAMSDDGEWVLLWSEASNLVAGVVDGTATWDVFLFQRSTGTMTLVSRSVASPWTTANGLSQARAISPDGEWILFNSGATDLVAGLEDRNGAGWDVFLYQRSTGTTLLASRAAAAPTVTPNGRSDAFAISANGEWVLYSSTGTNIVAGVTDGNNMEDVFLFRRSTGITQLVSRAHGPSPATPNGVSRPLSISADGEWVLFESFGSNVDAGIVDNNNATDLFLFQRSTGGIALISRSVTSAATTANGWSGRAVSSADGEWVLFASDASNLVAGLADGNLSMDVFVFRRSTGVITLASRSAASATRTANASSAAPTAISADGRWALFSSSATDLVAGVDDRNGRVVDVFLSERDGPVRLVSGAADWSPIAANGASYARAISANGASALFNSNAMNLLTDGAVANRGGDLFVHRPDTGQTTAVSRSAVTPGAAGNGGGGAAMIDEGAISADGEWVPFWSEATDLVLGVADGVSTADVFLFQVSTGAITLVSRSAAGTATGNGESYASAISADGEWVLFESDATNLVAGLADTNETTDVFLYQRRTGAVTLVSRAAGTPGTTANGYSSPAGISPDGEWILFTSLASNLVPGVTDDNATGDVFLFQRSTGTVSLVSRIGGPVTVAGNNRSVPIAMSACGGRILFESLATNLVAGVADGNATFDVFLYRRDTGAVELVSRSGILPGRTANRGSQARSINADGAWVLFSSLATDLVPGIADANGLSDVFLYEVATGSVTLVSRAEASRRATANFLSTPTSISADGEWVLFLSAASDLIAGVTHLPWGYNNVFLYRRSTGSMTLVTRSQTSAMRAANAPSESVAMSAGGDWVLFHSGATDLVAGTLDGNRTVDVFLARIRSGELFGDGFESTGVPLTLTAPGSAAPDPPPDGVRRLGPSRVGH